MSITHRQYEANDFQLISDFLHGLFKPGNQDGNWLQPAWEYMHSHPTLDDASLDRIRIWEESGRIAAVVHYESNLGEAFFQVHPEYSRLKPTMLDYAEARLFGTREDGKRYLCAYINDFDPDFETLAATRGYAIDERYSRPMAELALLQAHLAITLPEGFLLKSLADENNLHKINRVLWRGFNHPGEPPEEEIEGRRKMQSTPNFKKDLAIVAVAPSGDFVSFCGLWFDSINRIAYVEPMATDPDYRRMGLGKAALLEGIRRCKELGATTAFVGSGQQFYLAIGFELRYESRCWRKEL